MYPNGNKITQFKDLGLIGYQAAWDYQTRFFQETIALKVANRQREAKGEPVLPTPNYLFFCSHPHVYTLGKSGHLENLLLNEAGLKEREVTFVQTNRGGDITYHGPGQLVGYPVLDLDNFFTDIHRFMRHMEEAVIRTLEHYGIRAGRIPSLTGVWLDHETQRNPRKICAMGVKMSRWVSMHGFALNINPDLTYFNHIVPCGIVDKSVTSMEKELGFAPDFAEVSLKMKQNLSDIFEMELTPLA
jgi:lipoyl(octanoyl) transferase